MATDVIPTHRKGMSLAPANAVCRWALPIPVSAALLIASGTAALVYEVIWTRQLALVVGADVFAVTTAICAFFAGLAVGSFLLGRVADRVQRPARFYAGLELGVCLLAFGATLALARSEVPFAQIENRLGILAWIFPFSLVALPSILMGGTLPTLVRACFPQKQTVPSTGGWLYAANTAGGVAGALLASFVLIPYLGIRGSALFAASINFFAALGAILLERVSVQVPTSAARRAKRGHSTNQAFTALFLYAIAGGIALGYEVVWSQAIVPFLSTRAFAFSVVLATYLAGLVIGSALYARFAHPISNPWGVFGILIGAAGLIALLEIAVFGKWVLVLQTQAEYLILAITRSVLAGMCARFAIAALGVVFVPTILLGAAYPAVLRLAAGAEHTGHDVGTILALNTAGGIAGTMLTGFVLVPGIGLVRTLGVLAIAASALGIFAVLQESEIRKSFRTAGVAIFAISCILAALIPRDLFARTLVAARRSGHIVAYEESSGGTVAVIEEQRRNSAFKRLYIQGVSNSGDALPSLRYMRLQALLPLIIHRAEPTSALVIGFGTGITAGALLSYPLQERVSVELLPAVVRVSSLFQGNLQAASSPDLDIRLRDGRRELVQSEQTYDLITLEPPPPSAMGMANLYSTDFYRLASHRLRPSGLLAQWLPLASQNDEDSRSLVRSFLDAFPYTSAWTTELHEVLLVGSASPIELDANRIAARMNQPAVAAALQEVGIVSPEALLATWLTDREGLERYAAGAQPVTDDHPRIEYATWVRPGEITRVLPELLGLRSDPPIRFASQPFDVGVKEEWSTLSDFYEAGLAAYNQDRAKWALDIKRVLNSSPDNPYYRWALGDDTQKR